MLILLLWVSICSGCVSGYDGKVFVEYWEWMMVSLEVKCLFCRLG